MKNSKWLIVQANKKFGPYGEDNCEFLRECFSIKYALEQNGQTADIWGKDHNSFTLDINFDYYDYIFMEEQYDFDWIPFDKIGKSKAIKLQLMADIHVHETYLQWTPLFDIILHPIKQLIPKFVKMFPDKQHIWYPSSMDSRYYNTDYSSYDKKYNAIWMGSPTRKYVQELKRDIGLVQMLRAGQEYINTIAQAKVALNTRGSIDLNYKNYEITGLGTCLVTDYDDAFVELGFEDGVNCYFYKDYNECLYKIKLALSDDNYKRIGHNGFEFSKTQNYTERFKRLIRIMEENVLSR